MIKLYVMYLLIGCYMFFESDIIWSFSSDGNHIIAGLAVISSLLCTIAAGSFFFFNSRKALFAGLIGLAGVFPFGVYWLIFRYQNDYFTVLDAENAIIYVAVIIYFASVIHTIFGLITYKHSGVIISKWLRLTLSSITAILFGFQIFFIFY